MATSSLHLSPDELDNAHFVPTPAPVVGHLYGGINHLPSALQPLRQS